MVDFYYRGDAEDQHKRILRETDTSSLHSLATYLLVAFILALVLLAYCWEHQKAVKYGYEIESLKKEKEMLAEIHQKLTLERASLLSPQRVSDYARQYLGLTYNTGQKMIVQPLTESQVAFAQDNGSIRPGVAAKSVLVAFNQVGEQEQALSEHKE